jgi:hypothetical protein
LLFLGVVVLFHVLLKGLLLNRNIAGSTAMTFPKRHIFIDGWLLLHENSAKLALLDSPLHERSSHDRGLLHKWHFDLGEVGNN